MGGCLLSRRWARPCAGSQVGRPVAQRSALDVQFAPAAPLHLPLCLHGWPAAVHMGSLALWLPGRLGQGKVLALEQRVGGEEDQDTYCFPQHHATKLHHTSTGVPSSPLAVILPRPRACLWLGCSSIPSLLPQVLAPRCFIIPFMALVFFTLCK